MNAKSVPSAASFTARPAVWVVAWLVAWFLARLVLEGATVPTWGRVAAALAPVPVAAVALLSIVRSARDLDELERRIQLEALAFAFLLTMLLLMTLGLIELAVALNPDDWSYRHVWAMLPVLYFAGLAWTRRRYA